MWTDLNDAERLLVSLGVDSPNKIDLPIIASSLGLEIRYEPLRSCDARLVGFGKRGIITVRANANPRRKRFSIAHEIGHWIYHRGKALLCQARDIDDLESGAAKGREKTANEFASSLLLPRYLLAAEIQKIRSLNFKNVGAVADLFDVSLTATARRIVEESTFPAMLVCYRQSGRTWFVTNQSVPSKWHPRFDVHEDTTAFAMLFKGGEGIPSLRRNASTYFDRYDASAFSIREETVRTMAGQVLSLVTFEDKRMLE